MIKEEILEYFKSVPLGYAYFILVLDAGNRANMLNITKLHYYKKDVAYKWYLNIKEELVKLDDEILMSTSLNKLNKIYEAMVNYDK